MAVGALGPSLFVTDFTMGHIAGGVSSVFASFVFHRLSAFYCVMCLIESETQLTAFLHPGSLVSCHSFVILFLNFNSRSRPDRSLFKSVNVILLVASLYAEAIEAVKERAALSTSTPELISIQGDIKFEARPPNL
jgi:hypothetical protein